MANFEETGGFCKHCDERVPVRRKSANHILHLLLSLVTLGFWIPIWMLSSVSVGGWRCTRCGSKASTRLPGKFNMVIGVWLIALPFMIGCATFNNTVDRSRTVKEKISPGDEPSRIAIAAVPQNAVAEGLAEDLSIAIPAALDEAFPGVEIMNPETVGRAFNRHKGYLAHFAKWRSTYEQTGILDPRPLPHYAKALGGVSHILLIRSTSLDRAKVTVKEALKAAPCRRLFCFGDASNIWQTDLKVLAELIDMRSGIVAWRGVGEATRIEQGKGDYDFGVIVLHGDKGKGLETQAAQMVGMAAQGIAGQIKSASDAM